ncbi:hypothetical protein FOCC_FOCC011965 [Frankliniella occidentalis]|nr:hypothetical protein FOCC_FOCC011965 [Frankliniella occidentalis]
MFNIVTTHMNQLLHDTSGTISNVIKGDLWKEKSAADGEKMYLPINLHFDDYEPDNPLGSHHNDNSLGALYGSIGCLPRKLASSAENVFLVTIFLSKYRKDFGNEVSFANVTEEMTFLETEGIQINTGDEIHQIYFRFTLLIADNAGFHAVQGFVGSFSANFYCRFCKLHRDTMEHFCEKVPDCFLRTPENYLVDVATNKSLTGVKELCVFNIIPSFNCIENSNCDVLHDLHEGAVKYGICNILFYFVSTRAYFTIDVLKYRIKGFDYGPIDMGNKPPTSHLTVERLESCSWNLSASEMICVARYLGEMISDLIPVGNNVWKLYLLLREILEIILSPYFYVGTEKYLMTLIIEHHASYVQFSS